LLFSVLSSADIMLQAEVMSDHALATLQHVRVSVSPVNDLASGDRIERCAETEGHSPGFSLLELLVVLMLMAAACVSALDLWSRMYGLQSQAAHRVQEVQSAFSQVFRLGNALRSGERVPEHGHPNALEMIERPVPLGRSPPEAERISISWMPQGRAPGVYWRETPGRQFYWWARSMSGLTDWEIHSGGPGQEDLSFSLAGIEGPFQIQYQGVKDAIPKPMEL
jgi:prepilin-type N-terminal cleavage/methylation domain-containing protein